NVIRHAMKSDGVLVRVIHGESGPGIAIARLADRSRIDHVLPRTIQTHGELLWPLRRSIFHLDGAFAFVAVINPEAALDVRVSKKNYGSPRVSQDGVGFTPHQHILVFIERRTMHAF